MNTHRPRWNRATLALVGSLCLAGPVAAQVAGGTTSISMVESTRLAMGWSVKKTLMGKALYNDNDQKLGTVDDLIISPDKSVSYVIVGAGGFLGLGQHDVAIPVTQVEERQGKLVVRGATRESLKAMPTFEYVSDTGGRDRLMAAAERDIADGRAKVLELERMTGSAATDAKARINQQNSALKADLEAAEARLAEMKKATAARWTEFESRVSEATARLRKSIEAATG